VFTDKSQGNMPTASRVRLREESADDSISSSPTKSVPSSSLSKKLKTSSSSSSTTKQSSKVAAAAAATAKANVGNNGNTDDNDDDSYTIEKIINHRIDKKTGITTYRTRWLNYTSHDDTWEPVCNIASTGHVDRYIRSLQSQTLSHNMPHVAVIEYDDGETEVVNMSNEIFRPYNKDHTDEDMLYNIMEEEEGGEKIENKNYNDYGLLVVGTKIEILWKYAKMYFPCKILSYNNVTPPPPPPEPAAVATATATTTTAVPAIPPMEEAATAEEATTTTASTSIIDYLKKAWSPSRL
jgi:hypothetical protein